MHGQWRMPDSGRSVVVANSDAGHKNESSAAGGAESNADGPRARAAGAKKPGVIGKTIEQARGVIESIHLPPLDWRAFAWGLLIIVVLAFIARNWAPLRISFFGWYFDAPRAVVLVIMFLLGMMTAWLLEIRSRRKDDEIPADAEKEDEGASVEIEEDEADLFPEDDFEPVEVASDEE